MLFKALSLRLEDKAPAAFRFLKNFNYTTDDQQEIAFLVDARGMPVSEAAERWVDENPDVWRKWLS